MLDLKGKRKEAARPSRARHHDDIHIRWHTRRLETVPPGSQPLHTALPAHSTLSRRFHSPVRRLLTCSPATTNISTSRFLRARKFDVAKAHNQFAATEAWRLEHDVPNLYATFDPDELESSKRFYPRWTGRRDKVRQAPICPSVSIAPNTPALPRSVDALARSKAYPCTSSASHPSQGSKRSSMPSPRNAAISACACVFPNADVDATTPPYPPLPIALPSTSSRTASVSLSVLPSPALLHRLRQHRMRPPTHHHRRPSQRRRQLLTLAVSPLA